jgi:uncharacterized protein YndB with AHSA1/START domain
MSDDRSIELKVEVPGTPEEVWRAIATGPGITSWYVPHTFDEEKEGSAGTARFGPGPEMEVPGRIAVWEPPKRFVLDGGEDVEGMAFEWMVEAADGGSCIVRLVNSGFGSGDEWDAQYDAMTGGWVMFMTNLRLHLEHFAGQSAVVTLPTGTSTGSSLDVWDQLTTALNIPSSPDIGDRVEVTGSGTPPLAGTVADKIPTRLSLVLDSPCPGTAIVAAEQIGPQVSISIWTYLYGDEAADIAARDEPLWAAWLSELTPPA